MGEITAQAVKAFREKTGLPLMDCKRALTEANGDIERAKEILREQGLELMEQIGREAQEVHETRQFFLARRVAHHVFAVSDVVEFPCVHDSVLKRPNAKLSDEKTCTKIIAKRK